MSTRSLDIGLIGFGYWGHDAFAPAVEMHGSRVVAVAARSEGTHARIAESLPKAAIYDNTAALLAHPGLDAVIVAVPIAAGAPVMAEVLDAGIPAMWEPPVAGHRADLPGMIEKLRHARALTQPDLEFRFLPAVQHAAQLVGDGRIGDLEFVTARVRLPGGFKEYPIVAGHPLFDVDVTMGTILGTYGADPLHQIVGRFPRRVMNLDGHACPKRMQWKCMVLYDYGDGVIGTADINHSTHIGGWRFIYDLAGTDGNIWVDSLVGTVELQEGEGTDPVRSEHPALQPVLGMAGMRECVNAFLDAVADGGPGVIPLEEAVKLQELGLAVEASKDSGNWEDVAYS